MDTDKPVSSGGRAPARPPSHIASFRKITDGILASAALAAHDNRPEVAKAELARTLKRAAPALGIQRTTYQILDILLGLVRPEDFAPGKRPIVAISNDRLSQYTGATVKTVSRCLKLLVEAGILAYHDSPSGRRYVYRGSNGSVNEAYGLDFTPACFNLGAFGVLADEYRDALNRERNAKRAVTRLSRAIIDLVDAAGPQFGDFRYQAEKLVSELRHSPESCAEWLQALYDDVLLAVEKARCEAAEKVPKDPEMSTEGGSNVPLIYNTTQSPSVEACRKRTCSNEQELRSKTDNACGVEMALEKEPCGAGSGKQLPFEQGETPEGEIGQNGEIRPEGAPLGVSAKYPFKPEGLSLHNWTSCGTKADLQPAIDLADGPDRAEAGATGLADTLESVSIGLIAAACSLTQDETDTRFVSWIDLLAAVHDMRVLIGLSETGYAQAVLRHGKHLPAACLAVVAEKALRDPNQITSPGGYFRAMIDRASEHKLNLKKSLFGLANT